MLEYKQGDIIFIPYPYTDLSNYKQRPAVIISKDSTNIQSYIVAKITSVIRNDQFSFIIEHGDIEGTLRYIPVKSESMKYLRSIPLSLLRNLHRLKKNH